MDPSEASLELLLAEIRQKHGDALQAILVYGSWLRGKRDTMLDFYVLVEDYRTLNSSWQAMMCKLLPPNVYHIHNKAADHDHDGQEHRAKYALLTLERFRHAIQNDFHSYFWARFSQPCEILYARDETTRSKLKETFNQASSSFLRRVVPTMADDFDSRELWTHGLSLTYQCELRTEGRQQSGVLYDFKPPYFDEITNSFAKSNDQLSESDQVDRYLNQCSDMTKNLSSLSWWLRRVQGKFLSVLRLIKAAFTFNEPLEYLLWKIKRHSGIYIEPSPRQLKYPLIFSWPLLWKLYRQGAFR